MERVQEEAALAIYTYQVHVKETLRRSENTHTDLDTDTDGEKEENVGSEEESLKQKLGSIENDITELTKVCGEKKKKI